MSSTASAIGRASVWVLSKFFLFFGLRKYFFRDFPGMWISEDLIRGTSQYCKTYENKQ
jgi:hypothetical protein